MPSFAPEGVVLEVVESIKYVACKTSYQVLFVAYMACAYKCINR